MATRRHTLSIAVAGDAPPTEFRLFTAGRVETTKGTFLFDETAAKSVMAEYEAHGIDLMIDYDHASLSSHPVDPAQAGKAAGWFNLEVRNGELWAVNVRWTEPAAAALSRKEWRFMSPAFGTDEAGRITDVLNVALTNIPATRRLQPLMAASKGVGMDPKLVQQALDALIAGDSEKCAEILKGVIASAAGADPDAKTEDAPPPVGDGGADEAQEAAGAGPAAPAKDPNAPPAAAPSPDDEEKKAAVAAARVALAATGKSSIGEAMSMLTTALAEVSKLSIEKQALAASVRELEASERHALVAQLVKLGVEIPSTAWSDDTAKTPCARLANEPIGDLRARVAKLSAAKPGPKSAPRHAADSDDGSKTFTVNGQAVTLSKLELDECERAGAKPQAFAAHKLRAQRVKGIGNV